MSGAARTGLQKTRLAEASLVRANRLLDESQSIARLGGWEYDPVAKRVFWTPETYRIYGVGPDFDPNDITGDIGFYAPDSAPVIAEAFRRAVEAGESYDLEVELTRADGETIWVRTMGRALTENGAVVRVSGNIMDISDRKRAQLELAAMNAELERCVRERTARLEAARNDLETFVQSAAHDLKAPLRAIAGFSRMVAEDYAAVLDAEGKRRLGVVFDASVRLDALITDLGALLRLGGREIARERVAMGAMARAMYYEVASAADLAAVEFAIGELPDAVGDPGMLRKVWGNLFSNALKFASPSRARRIEVSAESTAAENVYAVRDNGIGFAPDAADRLFGLFVRLNADKRYGGTGAGLAIVKRIVEMHGGRVDAEGAVDAGAVFRFALPASAPDGPPGGYHGRR